MDFEKLSDRLKGFIQAAQTIAVRDGNPQITPEHLLKALLDDPEGMVSGLIARAGGNPKMALQRTDAASLYRAACCRAVTAAILRATDTSPDTAQKADAEVDRAMVMLRDAVAKGYKDIEQLKTDKNLDALRERDDFMKVVADLEARNK